MVDALDGDRLHLAGEGWFTASHILDVLVGPETYLLQRAERCRPALADISGAVPTVRVNVFVTHTAPRVDWPVLRLVAQGNPHSHSWLPGNLTCALDLDSGVILRALERQDPGLVEHTVDPVTAAPIVGRAIEDWDALLDVAQKVGRVFAPVRYLSLDVGLADRGPVVIEVNTGGGFGPWQRSSGRGVLDAQFRAFLTECGVTL